MMMGAGGLAITVFMAYIMIRKYWRVKQGVEEPTNEEIQRINKIHENL